MTVQDPYDDIPGDLVHQPEVLDATAAELDQLTRLLLPESIDVLRWAAARETASSAARALEAEARDALRALLKDPDDAQRGTFEADGDAEIEEDAEAAQDDVWRQTLERALSQDIHQSLDDEAPPWLMMRAIDLARTMAAVWIGFGDSDAARAAVLDSILGGEEGESRSPIDDLSRRFELSGPDTHYYLLCVNHLLGEASLAQARTGVYAQGIE